MITPSREQDLERWTAEELQDMEDKHNDDLIEELLEERAWSSVRPTEQANTLHIMKEIFKI
jgi:hypothetical protein